jgi:hypothetical protein
VEVFVTYYLKFPTHWKVLNFSVLYVMVFLKALHFDVIYSNPDLWNIGDSPILNVKCLIVESNLPCIMCLQLVINWTIYRSWYYIALFVLCYGHVNYSLLSLTPPDATYHDKSQLTHGLCIIRQKVMLILCG